MKGFINSMLVVALLLILSSQGCTQKIQGPDRVPLTVTTQKIEILSPAQKIQSVTVSLANQIGSSIAKEERVRIGVIPLSDLTSQASDFSLSLSEGLTTQLFKVGKFEIVEKTLIDKVLKELKLHETGAIDPATAKRVGKLAGVDAIVTGTITDLQSHLGIDCRLIDIQTGKILAVATEKVLKEELKPPSPPPIKPPKRDFPRTLYFGGDWLTVILDSVEIIEGRFIRFDLTFVNPFEGEARIHLDQPEQNTYIVDNLGSSYNFVSSLGVTTRGERRLRPRERVSISVVLEAHRRPAKYITLRTKWYAYGQGFGGGNKELVVRNISIAGL